MSVGAGEAIPGKLTLPALLLCGLLSGCASVRHPVDQALMTDRGLPARNEEASAVYAIGCPDVLDITIEGQPGLSGRQSIGPDGCINVGAWGRLRVEGKTAEEAGRLLAEQAGLSPAAVRVRVAEYRRHKVYLIGQVVGQQRAVPYQGPETVRDLLQRTGGITAGAAPEAVYVVRSHVAEGQLPEVFRVDLRAIVMEHDQRTNVRLQPGDQVFVGETRQCILQRCFPPWLRPLYGLFCGMYRPSSAGSGLPSVASNN